MTTLEQIEAVVSDVDELIERAKMILDGAPFFTFIPEERYVRLRVSGEKATLVWPEAHSGYYDSCSIEEQSRDFPADLLLMDQAAIEKWSAEQKRIYDENERKRAEEARQQRARMQQAEELRLLAELKAKYESGAAGQSPRSTP